ncbi:MAG: hypothetical protein JNM76_15425 [Betaproteobacteria bacterium]|nr:hypothetical protein [Betaproteobacteria bacterium]
MSAANPIANIRGLTDSKDCIAILSALSVLGSRDGAYTPEKLDQLLAAKLHFAQLLDNELPHYFSDAQDDGERAASDAFAKQIQLVHSHFASAFQRYVMRKDDWRTTAEDDVRLRLATGHAIDSFAALVKWSYFLHETLKGTSWSELHALYYLAEQQGYHHQPLDLHGANAAYNPSIQALYLRALVLDIINPGSLTAAQIEIAEGWLSAWCLDYTLESEFQPRSHLIYVDLAEHAGFHVVTPAVKGDSIRYLRADALRGQIEEVKNELRQGHPYHGLGTAHDLPVEEHATLLSAIERLYNNILAHSGNRIAERTLVENQTMRVVMGYDAVLQAVLAPGASTAAGLSLSLMAGSTESASETWKVHDFSASGVGLLVDRATGDVVPLQSLVAMRAARDRAWAVGTIVRKLTNRVQGQTLIGIELLSSRGVAVKLLRTGTAPYVEGVDALYLPGTDSDGKRDVLVLRQSEFAARSVFEVPTGGTHFRVRLNRTVKKGTDWIAMRFEVDNKR